jgi:hypothetical protein
MVDPADVLDSEPTSEIRSVDARIRRLVVDTGLRGKAAEDAWITVTDETGAVFFEGSASEADGFVEVSFDDAPHVKVARVLLETATAHRQAQVTLCGSWTSHAFA